ncbi:glycosyltransferase [Jongsikchunia kroppenstedtii]|uniref:glycosyltransferase n=1 Tax=Jongsikchunia kroppenstedtii TaxID=1121721 RepID=UPI00039C5A24|nr:glycosyltransferase [Jongsikchunia kroppenstedtii]
MADLLFVTMDAGGNVPPMLGIARATAARGHRVRLLGHERLRARVEAEELELTPFKQTRRWDASHEQSVLRWAPMLTDPLLGEEVRAACADRRPDVAVVDCMLAPVHDAVDRLGIPRVVLTHTLKSYYDGPYLYLAGAAARLRGHRVTAQWNRARANLVTTVAELDPAARRRQAPNVRWTGVVGPTTAPTAHRADPPLVLVSMSTNGFRGQRKSLQRIVDALGELPVRAVVTTGGVFAPDVLAAPRNVTVVGYTDHLAIMPECSLVVSHGGHSTVFRALAHDAPLLVIPSSRMTDQPQVGRAIADAGAAICLSRSASTRAIRSAIETLLREPRFHGVASELGARVRAVDGASTAADIIAEVVADP